jgi:hypothetical protein
MSSRYTWNFRNRSFLISRTGIDFLNEDYPYEKSARGFLAFPDASPTLGLMNVTYTPNAESASETNYYIIATDYFQYAIGWACEDLDDDEDDEGNSIEQSREFAWIFSRTPDLPYDNPALLARIEDYIDRFLDRKHLRWTQQSEA